MKEKQKLELAELLQRKYGIDIESYKTDNLMEEIMDLILFPKYALSWILIPIFISLGFFIAGFYIFSLNNIEVIVYIIFAFILMLLVGLFAGLWLFTSKLKEDLSSIIECSTNMTNQCYSDFRKIKNDIPPQERKNAIKHIFTGVNQLVLLPSIYRAIENKVPIVGTIISAVIGKVVSKMTDQLVLKVNDSTENEAYKISDEKNEAIVRVEAENVTNVISKIISIVQFPIKLLFTICAIVLSILIWILN